MIKKMAIGVSGCLVLLASGMAAQRGRTFTGEIMDSPCAAMASHEKMVQKNPISAEEKKQGTLDCVKAGGKFVLYNAASKTVYQLDDQKSPEAFAGTNVIITGTIDERNGTIHVTDIKPGA
jgi:hypothetical protein